MKTVMTLALISAMSLSVTACGKKDVPVAEMSAEQLSQQITGTWTMSDKTITQEGVDVRMYDSSVTYNADGTSIGSAKMDIQIAELPEDMRGFQMEGKSRWTISGNVINDRVTEMNVTSLNPNSQTNMMANAMQTQMLRAPESKATIVSVGKKEMVMNVEGETLTYRR